MKILLTTILTLLIFTSLFAQAPEAFNYQGVARDLSGTPLPNNNIALRIAVLQGSVNGTEVYKETHGVTTNDLGLFTLQVGTGTTVNGVFDMINWGADSHYLQIEMDENNGTNYQLIGTSQLLSVPYALNAKTAENVIWKLNGSNAYYDDGNIGIGTENPGTKLNIMGSNTDDDGNVSTPLLSIQNNNYSRIRLSAFSDVHYRNSIVSGVRGRGTVNNPQDVMPGDRIFGTYALVYSNGQLNGSPTSSIEHYVGSATPSGIINFSTLSPSTTFREERRYLY